MRVLARWHRRIGLAAAVLVLLVTVTGLLLQHGSALGLPNATITNRALLSLYFRGDERPGIGFRNGGSLHVWRDGILYSEGAPPFPLEARPVGVLSTQTGIVIATAEAVHLLASGGAPLERLDVSLLPGPVSRIGRDGDGNVVLATPSGTFSASEDFSHFARAADESADWSIAEEIPSGRLPDFVATAAPPGLPLDRILLDLHTGRLFGAAGVWIVNLGSLAFLVLAISGVVTALRRKNGS